jgi:hypothetical protein
MKTMNPLFSLLVFSTFIVFTTSTCKEKERKTIYIDAETKAYCDFRTGSWWVYKEEQTGLIDTIKITSYERMIETDEELADVDFESVLMYNRWSQVPQGNKSFQRIDADYGYGKDSKTAFVEEQYSFGIHFPTIIFYPINTVGGKATIYQGDMLILERKMDSLELEGKTYRHIKEISTSAAAFSKKQKRIYWSKNVGRIRFETYDGEVWNLIDHHVIK